MTAPDVLMVVPTLGRRLEMLALCLTSIRAQAVEVDLVVVAPATPEVLALVSSYGARHVDDPRSGGLSGALNAGLRAANPTAQYFAWLGDDDLLTDGSLATTVSAMDANPDAAMAFGWCDYIDEHGDLVFVSRAGKLAARILPWGPNLIPQPGCLMRLTDVTAVGGLNEDIKLAMDLDLFLRLRKRGRIIALTQTLASFRWHDDSATVSDEHASAEESDRIRQSYMSPAAARSYEYLRLPGRFALRMAKRRVQHNVRKQAAKR